MSFPRQELPKRDTYVWKCACFPTFSSNFSRKLKSVAGPGRIHSSSFQRKTEASMHSLHHMPSIPSLNAFASCGRCIGLKYSYRTQVQVNTGGERAPICSRHLVSQRDGEFFGKSTLVPVILPESSQGPTTASITNLLKHATSFSLNQSLLPKDVSPFY